MGAELRFYQINTLEYAEARQRFEAATNAGKGDIGQAKQWLETYGQEFLEFIYKKASDGEVSATIMPLLARLNRDEKSFSFFRESGARSGPPSAVSLAHLIEQRYGFCAQKTAHGVRIDWMTEPGDAVHAITASKNAIIKEHQRTRNQR